MIVKPFETEEERRACLEIAKALPEWFNEVGINEIERDLEKEKMESRRHPSL
ncbi:hypothetical protein [Thermococcus sp.]|uniref:hypothetical protein n=1 Tax=Thermococcus sp. TaxID=35749 RepID=UPI0026090FC0|nr:hypothetical protein [Thermococcus sp.]